MPSLSRMVSGVGRDSSLIDLYFHLFFWNLKSIEYQNDFLTCRAPPVARIRPSHVLSAVWAVLRRWEEEVDLEE